MYARYFILFYVLASSAYSEVLRVPFESSLWQILTYNKTPKHQVGFNNNTMVISVNKSAGPIVYPIKKPQFFKSFRYKAKITGKIDFKGKKQGTKGADDFRLRIGFVYQGKQTLGFFKRKIAADWVLKLFKLAPDGTGIDKIKFFNTFQEASLLGTSREHPLSDLLEETFSIKVSNEGLCQGEISIPSNSKILAVWISSDGDDLGASFTVELNQLELITKIRGQEVNATEPLKGTGH